MKLAKVKWAAWIFLFVCLSLNVACRKVALHQGLDEVEVDEILVLLHENGIEAQKELEENTQSQVQTWKITVNQELAPQARQILIANNLPRKKALGLSGVYQEKGLIPTPDEQKARFLLALKGEIINSLHKIPGVVDVDVVLNVPDSDEFSTTTMVQKRPTASVIVRTTNLESVTQTVTESKIQKFVANTIPNMDPNDVAVIISRTVTRFGKAPENAPSAVIPPPLETPASANIEASTTSSMNTEASTNRRETVTVAGMNVDEESAGRLKFYIAAFLLVLMALAVFLIFNVLRLNRLRMKVQKGNVTPAVPLAPGQNPNLLSGQGGDFGALGGANTGNFGTTFNQGNPGGGGTF